MYCDGFDDERVRPMPDLSSIAREAAREFDQKLPGGAYADGWADCASRLPSEEELAAEMKRHHFADNLLGNITWDMWMAKCECGWESGEYRYPGESSDAYYAHAAGAVLSLIGEKISG